VLKAHNKIVGILTGMGIAVRGEHAKWVKGDRIGWTGLSPGRGETTADCERGYAGPFGLGGSGVFLRHATVSALPIIERDFNADTLS
jgi:hypothetical protein